MFASQSGHIEIVKLLIEEGADVNFPSEGGEKTALMFASQSGHIEIVKLLIEAGADVNAYESYGPRRYQKRDFYGNTVYTDYVDYPTTPLMYASEEGYTDIVELLIEAGADVNFQDEDGWTALAWASMEGHTDIVKLLKEAGAKE